MQGGKRWKEQQKQLKAVAQLASQKGGGKADTTVKGCFLKNAKGKKLCQGFQTGACRSKWLDKQGSYDIICPHDKDLRHQCNLCLSGDHPPAHCNGGNPKKQKKGGKGKGGRG